MSIFTINKKSKNQMPENKQTQIYKSFPMYTHDDMYFVLAI